MKKIIIFLFVTLITISSCTPNKTFENDEAIESFSYKEHYNSSDIRQEKQFKNTTETSISTRQEAIKIAKNEVDIEYNQIEVFYDKECDMYMVSFYTEGMLGCSQNVYMDSKGITKLINYGE